MGVICTNNEELCNKLRFLQNCKYTELVWSNQLGFKFLLVIWFNTVCGRHFSWVSIILFWSNLIAIGPVPSPFDCYLANRGLKTLHLRMRQHQVNAMAVAKFLEQNPRVEKVVYPGMSGRGGSFSMTQGQIVGARGSLNRWKKKSGKKSRWSLFAGFFYKPV